MRAVTALLACTLLLTACGGATADGAKTIATGLHVPWGLAFEPSG